MDWNWFFSSISQSAAAIVGIFGAFIITKILSNQTAYDQKNARLKELIAESNKIKDDASDLYFGWYNTQTSKRALDRAADIIENGTLESAESIYDEVNFSPFIPRSEEIKKIDDLISKHKELLRKEEEEKKQRLEAEAARKKILEEGKLPKGFGDLMQAANLALSTNMKSGVLPRNSLLPNISDKLTEERDSIERVSRSAKHQIRVISDFIETVEGNPESSPQISYSLILVTALFYFGVIYPLSFMPQPINANIELSISAFIPLLLSLKGFLLLIVSMIFTSALAMFFIANMRMKYPEEQIGRLKEYRSISAYSPYFGIRESNQEQRRLKQS